MEGIFHSSTDTSKNPKIKLASQTWRTANSFQFLDQEDHAGEESKMNLLKLARQWREGSKMVKASEHQGAWILGAPAMTIRHPAFLPTWQLLLHQIITSIVLPDFSQSPYLQCKFNTLRVQIAVRNV